MDDRMFQYVLYINPFITEDDIVSIEQINDYEVMVTFKNGERYTVDIYTHYHRKVFYDDINELTEEQEKSAFAYRLRRLMSCNHVNQEELAEKIGVTQVMISRYVSGKALPNVMIARKIAKVLNCSMDDFFDKNP